MDPRQYHELDRTIKTLKLDLAYPQLVAQFYRVRPESTEPLDVAVGLAINRIIEDLLKDYLTTGVFPIPGHLLPLGLPVARQERTGDVVCISKAGNVILVGPPGSGKTTLLNLALLGAYQEGYKLFIPDPKNDTGFWPALDASFQVIDQNTAFNLLEVPPWRTVQEHIAELVELFRRLFYCGEQQAAVLRRALTLAYQKYEHPSLAQLHTIVDGMAQPKDTYSWRDACLGVSERLHKIKQRYPVAYQTARAHRSIAWLLQQHLYLPTSAMDPVAEFLITLLLHHIFNRNKHYGVRDITTVAAIDEGLTVVSKAHAASTISGTNTLATLATMNREFGIRLLFTSVDLSATDPLLVNTSSTIIILPGARGEQSLRHAGLQTQQLGAARYLRTGQALFLYPGQLPWPVIASFPPLPDNLKHKKRKPTSPTPPTGLLTSSTTMHQTAAPATQEAPLTSGMVNLVEQRLIDHLASAVIDTVSSTYHACGLAAEPGNRAKALLLKKGLITATPIIASPGRGGQATALSLTAEGRDLARVPLARHSRGTSAQGEYLVQALHRALPGSSVETDCNGKAPDLLLPLHPATLARLFRILDEHGGYFGGSKLHLNEKPIAIEIETSDYAKTLPNNITKDRQAGFECIIFALMKKDLGPAAALIERLNDGEGVFIVDALQLLSALREDQST